jgi:multisubunit Na+/H+ antiporter MnhG subunit
MAYVKWIFSWSSGHQYLGASQTKVNTISISIGVLGVVLYEWLLEHERAVRRIFGRGICCIELGTLTVIIHVYGNVQHMLQL